MSPRTGRPPKENSKDLRLQVRIDKETLKILDKCAIWKNTNRSEIVREGIKLVEEKGKKQHTLSPSKATECVIKPKTRINLI